MRGWNAVAAIVALAVTVIACGGSDLATESATPDALRIASFDFVESEILAEVYAQAAEGIGVPVVRLGAIGPREVVVPAVRNDQIDLVPEYLGSALGFAGAIEPPDDPDDAAAELRERVAEFEIEVLTPSSAVDVNVFVVTTAAAGDHGLAAVSDLAAASLPRLGGPAECPERPFCLAGLTDVYGLRFEEFVAEPSLAYTAEALRRGEIDVGVMFSTSPELDAIDLVALVDDRGLQPPEFVVPIVRRAALERWGSQLGEELDRVSARLSTADLRRLNGRVADGIGVAEVASEWLTTLG